MKGAFTGAHRDRIGRFQLADGGTLFLDEISEIPLDLQGKLLRVLQEMEFERVGGTKTINVDVRVLSASNRNLKDDIEEGTFREDLFYRLNVIQIEMPSLRERADDIPLLVKHFIEKYKDGQGDTKTELSPEAWKALYNYSRPGNVRELENVIERAVVLNSDGVISVNDFPDELVDKATMGAYHCIDAVAIRCEPAGDVRRVGLLGRTCKADQVDKLNRELALVRRHRRLRIERARNLRRQKMIEFGLPMGRADAAGKDVPFIANREREHR